MSLCGFPAITKSVHCNYTIEDEDSDSGPSDPHDPYWGQDYLYYYMAPWAPTLPQVKVLQVPGIEVNQHSAQHLGIPLPCLALMVRCLCLTSIFFRACFPLCFLSPILWCHLPPSTPGYPELLNEADTLSSLHPELLCQMSCPMDLPTEHGHLVDFWPHVADPLWHACFSVFSSLLPSSAAVVLDFYFI